MMADNTRMKEFGECRRRAPLPSQGGYKFPVTDRFMWCGEFGKEFRKEAPLD
jgi:hypothetical protein